MRPPGQQGAAGSVPTGPGGTGDRLRVTVTQLTALVRDAITVRPELEDILVEGELSNLRNPGSGHLYFTLKDASSSLRCVCFRSSAARVRFMPEAGMTVLARGRVDVYESDGAYQLYVDSLEPVGVGALALAVEQTRRRLAGEGLFDAARKRPLPLLPRRVAVVTSSRGAAVRDVCTVLRRRAPVVGVLVVPTPVQGDGADGAVVRALERAQGRPGVDVVLLVRGGGSFEDLLAFQSEAVARAVAGSRVPVVTGIGHETDWTMADWAADRRAATPSNAAEMAVPEVSALRDDLIGRRIRLAGAVRGGVALKRAAIGASAARLRLQTPARRLPQLRQHLDARAGALRSALLAEVAHKRRRLDAQSAALRLSSPRQRLPLLREGLRARSVAFEGSVRGVLSGRRGALQQRRGRLEALSPLSVLERGYSVTWDAAGRVLTGPAGLGQGELLRTRLRDGEVRSRVVTEG